MEDDNSVFQRDDITFVTEETDDISMISSPTTTDVVVQQQEEGAVKKNNEDVDAKVVVGAKKEQPQKPHTQNENRRNVSQKKVLWSVIVLLAIVVAILAGMLLLNNNNKNDGNDAPTTTSSDSNQANAIPTTQPTPSPSHWTPTTRRGRVEYILKDYAPLDERTMTWLLETSTWTPPTTARIGNYPSDETENYLWLERYALALLYSSTNGPYWARNDYWMSNEPTCRWFSLEPNACPGPITNLVLYLNKMEGTLPSVLFALSNLKKLHLARNQLTGSTIPSDTSNYLLKHLTFMDLASTGLKGSVPSSIRNMTQLESLYLSGNELTGPIFEEIGNMTNLTVLSLWGNQLGGTIPSSIGNMDRLKDLSLSENQLSGPLPTQLGSLTSLSRLSLHTNDLSGTIPESFLNMSNLQWLSLYENNRLEGSFPQLSDTVRKCFLGSCFSDITNAMTSRCIFFDNCY
ncbi:unnamed protein product [Cylindrotheca closterium]|uniref:L domain-like protein n=1 Tax=Cylindrotheca closterium TaxID=2856 RepID=A0AAD2PWL2_9STRA|nr:unnamed protein product [Cylindrotheca closterium]